MAKTRRPYARDFREKMVALVRSGRSPAELSKEFEPTAQTIINWVRQADRDAGRRGDGLTSEERSELRRIKRENRRLREERDILARPRPGSRGRPTRYRKGVRVRECESGRSQGGDDVPGAGGLRQRVLRVAAAGSVAARAAGRGVGGADRGDSPRFAGHVRRAADSRRTAGGRRAAGAQAGGAADAGERSARR